MTALQGAQSADYKPLLETAGSDSSEEREVATLTDSAEPEPEPEPAVRFDMAGEPLTLHIVRKIGTFMQGKDKQQNKSDGEDFAEAMAAIPGLQKRGTSNVLAKIPVKTDKAIDEEAVVVLANRRWPPPGTRPRWPRCS